MNTAKETVSCKIEHHAMMFAFLAKRAIEICGEEGKQSMVKNEVQEWLHERLLTAIRSTQ